MDELRKQQVVNKKVYDQKLMDDVVRQLALKHLQESDVMVGDMLIEKRRGEILNSKVDNMCYKEKF